MSLEPRFAAINAAPVRRAGLAPGLGCVAAAALALLLARGLLFVLALHNIDSPGRPFDAEVWRSTLGTTGPNARGNMVGDLRRHWLRYGMTRAQVGSMLGRPDDVRTSEGRWTYHLGPEIDGRLWMDSYTLDLGFDRDGRLRRAGTTQH